MSIIDGEASYEDETGEYSLHAGDTVIALDNMEHSFANAKEYPLNYLEVKFIARNQKLLKALHLAGRTVFHDAFAHELVKGVVDEYTHGRSMKDSAASAQMETLIYHLTKESRTNTGTGAENSVINMDGYSALSKKVIRYLEEHYSESISLDDIAKGCELSKNYLCNAFKKDTDTTIIEFLNVIRIRKAAEFVVYSDMSLAQIAEQCGFVSISHFNRVFMHHVGLPPGRCRRAYPFDRVLNRAELQRQEDGFMYSVLANKAITPNMINEYENAHTQRESADEES